MKSYTLSELKNHTGKIVDAAIKEPVSLTKHGVPALVLMSQEEFDRWREAADPRRAYLLSELPAEAAEYLASSLEAVTASNYDEQ
ncbi:type II toxin-antitoxin system Phd/YefM family antitoxin [Methylocystis sp. Sn-Cys]|uniref:type II toxin-antitoxin system Phd/YefM family antitoxin n=1 Tax=Methylocystis sp. Sn-Cys TaxID=1701263 RepID=UPI001920CD32|nr:type II toxin-antitoxin system Phd/YefM family antitoxin [Methylocystis sp. Sn-Cys]